MFSCPFVSWLPTISTALPKAEQSWDSFLLGEHCHRFGFQFSSSHCDLSSVRASNMIFIGDLTCSYCQGRSYFLSLISISQVEDVFNIWKDYLVLSPIPLVISRSLGFLLTFQSFFFYSLNISDTVILYSVPSNTIIWNLCRSDSAVLLPLMSLSDCSLCSCMFWYFRL